MPLAQGSLTDFLDKIGGQQKLIVDVMRQVCIGVSHVHDQGVYHRDLKPANVLRLSNGDWAVSDFGIGRRGRAGHQSADLDSARRVGHSRLRGT